MKPTYTPEEGMNIDGNFWMIHPTTGEDWDEASVAEFIESYEPPRIGPTIEERKTQGVQEIKREAAERITALDWKVQRANDRISAADLAGDTGAAALEQAEADLLDVLEAREAIREASNEAEAKLLLLETDEEIDAFEW